MDRPRTRSHPTLYPLTTLPSPTPSSSYLYPSTSIPSSPSLLSRPSSTTRLRPIRSNPTPILPTSKSSSSLSKPRLRKSGARRRIHHAGAGDRNDDGDDWITRTASTLTLTRLEEKGQSWLAARHSSTSLAGATAGDGYGDDEELDGSYHTAPSSRQHISRAKSARSSQRRLQLGNPESKGGSFMRSMDGTEEPDFDIEKDEAAELEDDPFAPDFVDLQEEDEPDEAETEEGDVVDEGEVRRVVMGRVGGWVDWAVGWLDLRADWDEDGDGDEEEVQGEGDDQGDREDGKVLGKGGLDPVELQRRLQRKRNREEEGEGEIDAERGGVGGSHIPPPSEDEQAGTWSDAKWLLKVATMAALE